MSGFSFRVGATVISWLEVLAAFVLIGRPVLAEEPAAQALPSFASAEASAAHFRSAVAPLFDKHCHACHGSRQAEGDLELTKLAVDMRSADAARWAMVLEKVVSREMPPADQAPLASAEIQTIADWVLAEMKRVGKHVTRRAEYSNGNETPHELLFGRPPVAPLDAASRARRLSPQIYEAFTNEVGKNVPGLAQPFSPSSSTTFQDQGAPAIDEPITQALMNNALAIVDKQTAHTFENGELKKVGFTPNEFLRLLDDRQPATDDEVAKALRTQFDRILRREPSTDELARLTSLYTKTVTDAGRPAATKITLAAVFLLPDAVFRWETGGVYPPPHNVSPDEATTANRRRLAPREIAFALAYALTDRRPERWLLDDAEQGKLDTREGVETAVRRMLDDSKLDKPRIMRFFREYFDYAKAAEVFKDPKANPAHEARVLVEDLDHLIEYVLAEDRQVLHQLLTTNKSFVAFRTAADTKQKRIAALAEFNAKKAKEPEKYKDKTPPQPGRSIYEAYNLSDFPDEQPVALAASQRAGVLTQPGWLVAFSKSDDNDAIRRGKWIRERLLGGVVPDVPITVDAQLPNAPEQTLRERMQVTRQEYCWQCHTYMNRLGLVFESYDHFGRYRTAEAVLDQEATEQNVDKKGKPLGPIFRDVPVDATGGIDHVADPKLAGDANGAVELLHRLATSELVEQVFVRHAFRYWLGRNESLGDTASLQAAHRAYRASDGSMRELIVAILTSDSFLYRAITTNDHTQAP